MVHHVDAAIMRLACLKYTSDTKIANISWIHDAAVLDVYSIIDLYPYLDFALKNLEIDIGGHKFSLDLDENKFTLLFK